MLSVIFCAAGSGTRAHLPENKVLCELNGMPVLAHSLSAFAPFADEMIVACRAEDEARVRALLSPYPNGKTVIGGSTRAESVFRALGGVTSDMVIVHDAARPFVSRKIIEDCIASIRAFGSGVCALPATDTVVSTAHGYEALDRSRLFTVQTPQGFLTQKLRLAYDRAFGEGRAAQFTDDSGIYAAYIEPPRLFTGERANRKLTYPEDLLPVERVGIGVDTHAFAHAEEFDRGIARLNLNYITLCGVTVPSDRSLIAHSDGDVAVHALMDALLSAIGERDIGFHFPDDDPAYKGADSMRLLASVLDMVWTKSLAVQNVSLSILAETPRLSPYIEEMRQNLQRALACENVGIAAGTNEKLGYVGEKKGITCYAAVMLKGRDKNDMEGINR